MVRSILITGCSTGIGHCCALGMHERGWQVFATVRSEEDGADLAKSNIDAFVMDYTRPDTIVACVAKVMESTKGQLDVLFNNGAYGQPGALEDLPVHALRAQFEANFFGWHDLTRQILPFMLAAGKGRIINCSSVLGFAALKYRGAYIASKFALEGYTDTLRLELVEDAIHVVSIQPGPIDTPFAANARLAFDNNINWRRSRHVERYKKRYAASVHKANTTVKRWELPPDAVFKALVKACESASPKPVYRVTAPTHLLHYAKKILPTKTFLKILFSVSQKE
jgi:NAD(P)-dependent dehydrogenase (short-subunit alcohol dehydrogenase family)